MSKSRNGWEMLSGQDGMWTEEFALAAQEKIRGVPMRG